MTVNMQAKPLVISISGDRERGDEMRSALRLAVDEIAHRNEHLVFQKVEARNNGPQIRELTAFFRETSIAHEADASDDK